MKEARQAIDDGLRALEASLRAPLARSDHNFAPEWFANGMVVRWLGWRHRRTVYLAQPNLAEE